MKKQPGQLLKDLDLNYSASDRPGRGIDHALFAAEDIPIFYFMTAMHPDHHQPSDETTKINWDKMLNIIRNWIFGYPAVCQF